MLCCVTFEVGFDLSYSSREIRRLSSAASRTVSLLQVETLRNTVIKDSLPKDKNRTHPKTSVYLTCRDAR
jgi:hypothetical protein